MARAADRAAATMLHAEPRRELTKLMAVFKTVNFPEKLFNELYYLYVIFKAQFS